MAQLEEIHSGSCFMASKISLMETITWKYFRLVPPDELSEATAKTFILTLLCKKSKKYNSKYVEAGNDFYFVFVDGSFQYQ